MIYNVGDKVRIKSKEWYDENKDEDGNVNIPFLFNSEMSYYCGEITTITKIEKYSYYRIYLDGEKWNWSDEMFDENYKDILVILSDKFQIFSAKNGTIRFYGTGLSKEQIKDIQKHQ